jgi:DNA-binding Lrp family transcriptional regulator
LEAFILLKAVGDHSNLMAKLSKLNTIVKIFNVTGDVDIITHIKVKDLDELKNLINSLRSMDGVLNTTSYIVLQELK